MERRGRQPRSSSSCRACEVRRACTESPEPARSGARSSYALVLAVYSADAFPDTERWSGAARARAVGDPMRPPSRSHIYRLVVAGASGSGALPPEAEHLPLGTAPRRPRAPLCRTAPPVPREGESGRTVPAPPTRPPAEERRGEALNPRGGALRGWLARYEVATHDWPGRSRRPSRDGATATGNQPPPHCEGPRSHRRPPPPSNWQLLRPGQRAARSLRQLPPEASQHPPPHASSRPLFPAFSPPLRAQRGTRPAEATAPAAAARTGSRQARREARPYLDQK